MIREFSALIIIFFCLNHSFSQEPIEFLGVLTIHDTTLISYRLNLKLVGKKVNGYSVTNIGGPYETKSYVTGEYDAATNMLQFKEYGIEYTKSEIDAYDFCFVHFKGLVKKIDKTDVIEGDFSGKYEDGVSCIDGELMVKSIEKIYKKAVKTDRKIQRLKIIPDSVKNSVNLTKAIDEKRINLIRASEKTSILCKSNSVSIEVWDAGKIDGDRISLFLNDSLLIKNYEVDKNKKVFTIPLNNQVNTFTIVAENVGNISPNTAKIDVLDGVRRIEMFSDLEKSERTTLVLHKFNTQ